MNLTTRIPVNIALTIAAAAFAAHASAGQEPAAKLGAAVLYCALPGSAVALYGVPARHDDRHQAVSGSAETYDPVRHDQPTGTPRVVGVQPAIGHFAGAFDELLADSASRY